MDRHERSGRAANIAAFVLEGCLISGIADAALKDECSIEDIAEIKDEMQQIVEDLMATAKYHKSMGNAIKVKPGAKKGSNKP